MLRATSLSSTASLLGNLGFDLIPLPGSRVFFPKRTSLLRRSRAGAPDRQRKEVQRTEQMRLSWERTACPGLASPKPQGGIWAQGSDLILRVSQARAFCVLRKCSSMMRNSPSKHRGGVQKLLTVW